MDTRKIVHIGVVHRPAVSVDTGLRKVTKARAKLEVAVVLEDGTLKTLTIFVGLRRGVRVATKVARAEHDFSPLMGLTWGEVQSVVGKIDLFPDGRQWGFTYSGQSRWFSCFCGKSTEVDKPTWRTYQEGTEVEVRCMHCTLTRKIKK